MNNEITINVSDTEEMTVHTVAFEPVTAYRLLAKIGRVLIPAAFAAKGAVDGQGLNMMGAVNALFDQLTPELAESVMLESLASTVVVRADANGQLERIELGKGVKSINKAFRGSLAAMLKTIKHALEVNYGDFFAVSAAAASAPTTPNQ